MSDEEMIEWAIKAVESAIRAQKKEIEFYEGDPKRLDKLIAKLGILKRRLNHARSFTNPLGIEN